MGSRPSLWMEPPSPLVKHRYLVVIVREEAATVWRLLSCDNSHLRCTFVAQCCRNVVLQQVGSYLRQTGRGANAFGKAALQDC